MPDLGRPVQAVSMAVTNLVKVSIYIRTAQNKYLNTEYIEHTIHFI